MSEPSPHTREWGFSRWMAGVWVLWMGGCLLLALAGVPRGLGVLFPGAPDNAFVFVLLGGAFGLAFLLPLLWDDVRGRLPLLKHALTLVLCILAPYPFLFAIGWRLVPLAQAGVWRAGVLLAAFGVFSYLLFQYTRRWYFLIQVLAGVGGPLVVFFFTELSRVREAAELGAALESASVFVALERAVAPVPHVDPTATGAGREALVLYGLAAVVLWILPQRRAAAFAEDAPRAGDG